MTRMYDPDAANSASPLRAAANAPKTAQNGKPKKAAEVPAPPPPRGAAKRQPVRIGDAVRIGATVTLDSDTAGMDASHAAELREDIERVRRSGRRPMGVLRQKLALAEIPGYWIHWFNDTAGRVDQALSAGFTHIKDQEGKPRSLVVGVGRDGKPLIAYAMKIPAVFHEEDMAMRHAEADAKVAAVKRNPFMARPGEATKADTQRFYTPETAADPISIVKG